MELVKPVRIYHIDCIVRDLQGRNIKIIREDEFLGMLWRDLTGKNDNGVKEHAERAGGPSCSNL